MTENPSLYIPLPKQTRGKRGGQHIAWKMVVKSETHLEGLLQMHGRDQFYQTAAGELRDAAFVSWVPPLTFDLVIRKAGRYTTGVCTIMSGAARLTELGFSYAWLGKATATLIASVDRWMALSTFRLQQARSAENVHRQKDDPDSQSVMSPLPRGLLAKALQYAQ